MTASASEPLPNRSSQATTSEISRARRQRWAEVITAERARTESRRFIACHHGSPRRAVLDVQNPPHRAGRYHRIGGRPTWYGSSSEAGAWAEFIRSLPEGADPAEFQRRIGRVDFDLVALDLASPELQRALGVKPAELTADDLTVCQTLADLAAEAGFDGVLGPSAAAAGETTVAVFGKSIGAKAAAVVDQGVKTPTGL